jgi:hypothetical protein
MQSACPSTRGRPRKLLARMTAPRRAPTGNRYYGEFRSVIQSALGSIESYCFRYDQSDDPSITAIILLRAAATAAGIQHIMHQLQHAFTDIDNTSFTVTTDAAAFAAMASQCDNDDDDDDDDVGDDDDDGAFDGNVDDVQDGIGSDKSVL